MSNDSILPAAEWALCRVVPPGTTEGGIVIPEREGTHKLVLVQAAEGHYTAGTFVPFKAPKGSRLIPRPTAEVHDIGALLAQHVLVHLRDVVGFIPPET